MGWFDDLQARVSDFQDTSLGGSISDYLESRVVDAVVKIGDQPTGNLSAAQIAAGQRGGTAPVVAPAPVAIMPSSHMDFAKYLPFILLGTAAYFLIQKQKKSRS